MSKKSSKHTHGAGAAKNERGGTEEKQEEMCCDGSGRSAAEHRAESPDGKCCVDE